MKTNDDINFIHAMHSNAKFGTSIALSQFLYQNYNTCTFIYSPLDSSIRNELKVFYYRNRTLAKEYSLFNLRFFSFLNYFRDLLGVMYVSYNAVIDSQKTIFVGSDPLNALAGIFLRKIKRVKKVIYYSVDYSPKRFDSSVLNFIYHIIDAYVVQQCDVVWNVSTRMQAIRKKQGKEESKVLHVPNGVYTELVGLRKTKSNSYFKFIYAGDLAKGKNLEQIILTLSNFKYTNFQLDIYGKGELSQSLSQQVKKAGLGKRVKFFGQKSNAEILKILPMYDIGIALYTNEKSYTYYCDPVKVKEYLAAGLYILVSDIPEIAETVESKGWGKKINSFQHLNEILEQILKEKKVPNPVINKSEFLLDWSDIYKDALTSSRIC